MVLQMANLLLPEALGAQTTKIGNSWGSLFFSKRKHDKLTPVVWDFKGALWIRASGVSDTTYL